MAENDPSSIVNVLVTTIWYVGEMANTVAEQCKNGTFIFGTDISEIDVWIKFN